MMRVIILFIFVSQNYARILTSLSLNIHISSLNQCAGKDFPVQVSNVTVRLDNGNVIVSGTLSTSVELASPLKAVITAKRKQWGVWIKMPCIKRMGSCTYDDLCIYGIPSNTTCPKTFIANDVPCRCPYPKGTYIIQPSIDLVIDSSEISSIYSGKYWAKVLLTNNTIDLTCYELYFEIQDAEDDLTAVDGYYNDIEPSVILV